VQKWVMRGGVVVPFPNSLPQSSTLNLPTESAIVYPRDLSHFGLSGIRAAQVAIYLLDIISIGRFELSKLAPSTYVLVRRD
jgi:hypothetical protein